jgi:protoporphyrinogen oxidase
LAGVFTRFFFKSYSEKLWGISCRDLDADFATQRIRKFSLSAAIKSALGLTGSKKHKTLVDRFAYPDEGTGQICDEMARRIREMGGNIMLRTPVAKVEIQGGEVKGLHRTTGEFAVYDEVVSTMPLTAVVRVIEEAPPAVQELVNEGAVHDLWAVNTDYEVYQEASTIDETGLVVSR